MASVLTTVAPAARTATMVLQTAGLIKIYRMGEVDVHALRGVDLELYESEFTVLLGVSGPPPSPSSLLWVWRNNGSTL